MGWAVGWDSDHGRWRGYGVPAYCDAYAKGCRAEIDRGLDSVCECDVARHPDDETCWEMDAVAKTTFVCGNHSCADVDEGNLPPEHPEWVEHLLTDDSWAKWRDENPGRIAAMRGDA